MATELQNTQRDVLTLDLSSNPYFKASPIPTRNNLLKTVSKRIIGAINEIVDSITSTNKSVDDLSKDTGEKFDSVDKELEDIKKGVSKTINIDASVKELSENLTQVSKNVDNISKSGGGLQVPKETINLGDVFVPNSAMSIYQTVGFIKIPDSVKAKIDFTKPLRLQFYRHFEDKDYGSKFRTLFFDNSYGRTLGAELFDVGYSDDHNFIAIHSMKYECKCVDVTLILE